MIYDQETALDYARLRRVHRPLLSALVSGAGINEKSRVLEVGCGTGNYISGLQSQTTCSAWGIDPSIEMLSKAQFQTALVAWVCAPAENTGLADSQFDFVFSVDAIHHFRDRARTFRETNRLLSQGGVACIATDSEEIIRSRTPLSVYWPETIELELARYPRIKILKTELRDAGFTDLRHEEVQDAGLLTDAMPYQAKAFSCLHLLSEDTYQRGLRHLEADLAKGPVRSVSRYLLLWAKR
jgi:SAM-dependent methyltransferase